LPPEGSGAGDQIPIVDLRITSLIGVVQVCAVALLRALFYKDFRQANYWQVLSCAGEFCLVD